MGYDGPQHVEVGIRGLYLKYAGEFRPLPVGFSELRGKTALVSGLDLLVGVFHIYCLPAPADRHCGGLKLLGVAVGSEGICRIGSHIAVTAQLDLDGRHAYPHDLRALGHIGRLYLPYSGLMVARSEGYDGYAPFSPGRIGELVAALAAAVVGTAFSH